MQKIKIVLILSLFFAACGNIDYSGKGNDVATAGDVTLLADYGDSFLVSSLLDIFTAEYPKANIKVNYLCEDKLLRQLEMDSARFALTNRDFTSDERNNLENRNITIRSIKIASTSIAVIVHNSNPINQMKQQQIFDIVNGKANQWNNGNEISLVFDGACGGNYLYLKKLAGNKESKSKKIKSIANPKQLIQYIAENKNAIGFVNVNWLADKMDSMSMRLVKSIKVLKVENTKDGNYYFPFQSQIAAKQYPFVFHIYMHDLQGYTGLAHGFTAWVSSQPGQIIVKKSGLVPAHDHGRTIEITEE